MTEPLLARADLYPFTTQRGSLTKNKNGINNSSPLIQRDNKCVSEKATTDNGVENRLH